MSKWAPSLTQEIWLWISLLLWSKLESLTVVIWTSRINGTCKTCKEWQNTIGRSPPPPKILGQKSETNHWGDSPREGVPRTASRSANVNPSTLPPPHTHTTSDNKVLLSSYSLSRLLVQPGSLWAFSAETRTQYSTVNSFLFDITTCCKKKKQGRRTKCRKKSSLWYKRSLSPYERPFLFLVTTCHWFNFSWRHQLDCPWNRLLLKVSARLSMKYTPKIASLVTRKPSKAKQIEEKRRCDFSSCFSTQADLSGGNFWCHGNHLC